MTRPIFMVGARGCGKTTVGGALARALGYQFVDTDI
ncbi:shikimate kinase, partial [Lonsdalea populi]